MKAPLSWLKDYVEIDITAQELQDKLFSCGFEVEELIYLGKDVEKVVVGRIEKIYKHPNADKLQICVVDCGTHGTLQICTAATNVFEGAKVPVATDGATVLHEGATMKIKVGKMRGEDSQGMLCSGEELGINEDYYPGADVYGILILAEDTPVGEDVRKVVGLDDYLFDIAVTANRPDCQSVLGIAREVAAVLKKPLKLPDFSYTEHPVAAEIRIAVQAPDLCPRYIGHYVRNITPGQSPRWMRRDLALDLISEIPGMECNVPNGAFYLFPKYSVDMPSAKLAEVLLREGHVAVTPGTAFGPAGEGHFRVSYAASEEQIREGLDRIKRTLAQL